MTEIAESLIKQSLKAVAGDIICEACLADKNDDCKGCYINDEK
ncbi:MAG: hypothetical protein Q8L26_08545 [Candidatus Omnitrophota bacterium]|nr:hypothetical protein [Candidatus Omnitrophota bacterium]